MNVMSLAVLEEYRGRGLGTRLLTAGEEYAAAHGTDGVRLSSGAERVKAHEFYISRGYESSKHQKRFIKYFGK